MYYRFENRQSFFIKTMYSLFLQDYAQGFSFPGELHDFCECVYVVRGSVCVSADDRVYDLTRADLIFHKPMEIHKFHIETTGGAQLLIFSFDMSGEGADAFYDKVYALNEEQRSVLEAMLRYLKRHAEAQTLQTGIFLHAKNDGEINIAMVTTYLTQLFLLLQQEGGTRATSHVSEAAVFSAAATYLNAHINDNVNIDTLCRAVGCSRSGLKRMFRRYADMGIHEYFLHVKLRHALRLLQDGVRVTEVSALLGFSSQAYFSRVFKRVMGYAPSHAYTKEPLDNSNDV